jgi:hypothetical protein
MSYEEEDACHMTQSLYEKIANTWAKERARARAREREKRESVYVCACAREDQTSIFLPSTSYRLM